MREQLGYPLSFFYLGITLSCRVTRMRFDDWQGLRRYLPQAFHASVHAQGTIELVKYLTFIEVSRFILRLRRRL
jgi:hypothetical protein